MGYLSSVFNSLSGKSSRKRDSLPGQLEKKDAREIMRAAEKNGFLLRACGSMDASSSGCFISVYSKTGEKGVNQDSFIVWKEYGCQEDMLFCGIFDGHGEWGHYLSKKVRESMAPSLLCNWQQIIAQPLDDDTEDDLKSDKHLLHLFYTWKLSYTTTCASIDEELKHERKIDSFYSGTTSLSMVKQGELIVLANVGDSRAVLATRSEDGSLQSVQLTVDMKPDLPEEEERIMMCRGRVFGLNDEPGVLRVWLPDEETPGLAMSRAFGDYIVKEHGVISVPEVTRWDLTNRDEFIILATDGVWDVLSNDEAVQIVSSTSDRAKSAKRLAEHARTAWKKRKRGIASDDISAVCLFFHV